MSWDAAPTQPATPGLAPLPKLGYDVKSTYSVCSSCDVKVSSSSRCLPAAPVLTCDHLRSETRGEGELPVGPGGRHGGSLVGSRAADPTEGSAH